MDVLTFETCWAVNGEIIKRVTSSWSIFIQLSLLFRILNKNDLSCFPYAPADSVLSDFLNLYVYLCYFSPVSSLFGFQPIMFYFSPSLSGLFALTLRMFERLCSIFKCCLFFAPLTDLFGFLQIMFSLLSSTFTFI